MVMLRKIYRALDVDRHYLQIVIKNNKKVIKTLERQYENRHNEFTKEQLDKAMYIGEKMTKDMVNDSKTYETLNKDVIYSFGQKRGDKIEYVDIDGKTVVDAPLMTNQEKAISTGIAITTALLSLGAFTILPDTAGAKNRNYNAKRYSYGLEYDNQKTKK